MASAFIAMHWKLHGPQLAISTACASSLDAIGLAAGMIERGEIEAAIAGGSETLLSPLVYESLVRAGALSRNRDVAQASRPFDVDRDGFVMGDGAGILVLERAERAQARGARILARIRGYGSVADAYHITSPDPSARYEVSAMRDAIESSGEAGEEMPRRLRARHGHDRRRRGGIEGDRRRLYRRPSDRHVDQRSRRAQHGERRSDVRDCGHHRHARRPDSGDDGNPKRGSADALRSRDGARAPARTRSFRSTRSASADRTRR